MRKRRQAVSENGPVPVKHDHEESADPKPSVSDCLAMERSHMANERTLLAYIRTAMAMAVVGATALKFFVGTGMMILGYTMLAAGVICFTAGLMRFTETMNRLSELASCKNPRHSHPGNKG